MNSANQNSSMIGNDPSSSRTSLGQISSMIENDPSWCVPCSSPLPFGQISSMIESDPSWCVPCSSPLPFGQISSMIENDPRCVPCSSPFPFGQSSSMLENQFNTQSIEESKTISENEIMQLLGDEEFNSKPEDNDNQLDDGQNANNDDRPNKRMRQHRHTQHQIQEMEALFKEYPQPDKKQRKELSHKLGLEPSQVKFWFQNKRTLIKNQGNREENSSLRAENDKLRAECVRFSEAITNGCPNCVGPRLRLGETSYNEQQLRLENARLQKMADCTLKPYAIKVAAAAMEEFLEMAQTGEPLWLLNIDGRTNILNEEEYVRRFLRGNGPNKPQGIKTESSRENAIVVMNHINLVEILMDTNHWASLFSSIVSTAFTMKVLSTGVGKNLNGAMQMIYAEFQVPTPQVPTRDCYFVRFCKRTVNGIWAVVDVSLDHTPTTRCRKRPSGCLIQEMSNGNSKVTWIEHIEADNTSINNIYMPFIDFGLAFGAKRWIATLNAQCERLASAIATNLPQNNIDHTLSIDKERTKNMLKLGERMVISYCSGVSATTTHQWKTVTGSDSGIKDVRFMTRQSINDPGRPRGLILSASTSFWLPIPPKTLFDFLRDENTRVELDNLFNGGKIQEVAHIPYGRKTGNCVSILRVNCLNSAQSDMMIVQDSSTDPTGSFVVYAPIDIHVINTMLCGGDPEYIPLLPSGFAILPGRPSGSTGEGVVAGLSDSTGEGVVDSSASLLTVAFQILVDSVPTANISPQSIDVVNNRMSCTIDKIKAALLSDIPSLIDLL